MGRGKKKKKTNRAPGDKNRWPAAALGDIAIINQYEDTWTHNEYINSKSSPLSRQERGGGNKKIKNTRCRFFQQFQKHTITHTHTNKQMHIHTL